MKLKYMIPALCICTCTAMPEMLHAQDDSLKKDSTERPFNAMDYVLQKRYIPQGREVNNSQPGKNFSLSVMGGVNKLRGSSSLPAWFNGGIALTKDVSSFNSYRVSLLGGIHTVALAHIAAYTQYGIQADVCAAFVPADIIGQVEQVVQLDAALFQLIVEAAQQRQELRGYRTERR